MVRRPHSIKLLPFFFIMGIFHTPYGYLIIPVPMSKMSGYPQGLSMQINSGKPALTAWTATDTCLVFGSGILTFDTPSLCFYPPPNVNVKDSTSRVTFKT